MTKSSLRILPLILLAIVTTSMQAQARLAIYGTAGTEESDLPNSAWKLAGTFGLYYGIYDFGPVYLSVDARGDLSSDINSGFAGPRLAVKLPVLPLKPYGEIIFGVSSYPQTVAGLQYSNNFAYRYVVGLDSTILPHLDWRVVDFSYANNTYEGNDHAKTVTSGLVIRF